MFEPLPVTFAPTRDALHALAEQVLAPARYHAEGRIGLINTPGGFGTPVYGAGERARVEGIELVHERPGATQRVPITNLSHAARFVGAPLGAPADLYPPATTADPDASLAIDADAARILAAWLEIGATLLDELRDDYATQEPSAPQLWPEHFDLACDLGNLDAGTRATYGVSPGDADIAEPYLYVSPWEASRRTGVLGRKPFGAACSYRELGAEGDGRNAGRAFFSDCAALLLGAP